MNTLSLVIPCYNEAARLPTETFRRFVAAHPSCHLCFVDDGSRDATPAKLRALAEEFPAAIEILTLPKNAGKAAAVRAGVLHCIKNNGRNTIGFWDADLATPLDECPRFLDILARYERIHGVVGARWQHLGARIDRRASRHAIGRCVAFVVGRYLAFDLYDSQCGAKIFRRADAALLFADPFVSRWLFDVELFKRMTLFFGADYPSHHICELPLIEWRDVAGSKLKFRHTGLILREFLKIRAFYRAPKNHRIAPRNVLNWPHCKLAGGENDA